MLFPCATAVGVTATSRIASSTEVSAYTRSNSIALTLSNKVKFVTSERSFYPCEVAGSAPERFGLIDVQKAFDTVWRRRYLLWFYMAGVRLY